MKICFYRDRRDFEIAKQVGVHTRTIRVEKRQCNLWRAKTVKVAIYRPPPFQEGHHNRIMVSEFYRRLFAEAIDTRGGTSPSFRK